MSAEAGLAAGQPTVVVENALTARQWEAHLAAREIAAGAAVWETPRIRSYGAWLAERWLAVAPDEPAAILTPAQSAALWRRVIAESPAGDALLGHAGAAEWAAAAATLLRRWRVDAESLRASRRDIDFRAFLDWTRRYRRVLREQGWRDNDDLEAALLGYAPNAGSVLATDLGEAYPARAALFAHLEANGCSVREQQAPVVQGRRRSARFPDATEELRAAFDWAGQRLERNPAARIAIVVADLDHRRHEIERLAALASRTAVEVPVWIDGGALDRDPAVGAAVSALQLLTAQGGYAAFGRWLRSPFFGASTEQASRARLDRRLRESLISRLPFNTAYRDCGLSDMLREWAPLAAQVLARALREVGNIAARAVPSRWAHLWSRYLAELQWQPPARRAALLGWQSALDELARLTPILGEISLPAALAELERIVERAPLVEPLPLRGVHVLRRIDAVGPGYDAVWVGGFTDAVWPEPPRGNPLLPTALQRELGLPFATPQDAERRSTEALARLVARTPNLVVSWPARVYDYETEPSPAIVGWEPLDATEAVGLDRARAPAPALTTIADSPPRLVGARLKGGSAVLGRQARCPLRAFCQDRLGARALEPLRFGLDARLRGIAAHRAAELLLGDLPSQEALLAKPAAEIANAARRALDEAFGAARRTLRVLWQLELEQLDRQLAAFLRLEALREPFRVRAVEQSSEVMLGPLTVRLRVDRLDELADGTLAVLDYKTGERASGGDWFTPRLRDAQVPLYASQASASVGAAVIARLTTDTAGYAGIWPAGAFPGRRSPAAADSVADQIERWRLQVDTLVAEFVGGDVRILLADYEDALGAYAPLTRIHEQLALAASATTPA